MKKNCRNCHFLAKEHRDESGKVYTNSPSPKERDEYIKDAENAVPEYYSLNCHMGVWDEGIIGKGIRDEILNKEHRRNCFFFKFIPGMMFNAAKELQKREQEEQAIRTSNLYTRVGLWVAAGALCVNAFVSYIRLKCG
jgi:hypothetical protein